MFNVNNVVQIFGSVYDTKKKDVVRAMKADSNEKWKQRGRRFEVFRPRHEHPQPSEWYVSLYTLLRPTAILGLVSQGEDDSLNQRFGERQSSFGLRGISDLLRRRRTRPQEPEMPEEPWVF